MVQTPVEKLTLEAFLALPETKPPSEYIDGRIIQKPMPKGKHSLIQASLTSAINEALKDQQVAFAFPELRCTFGGRSIVPDVSVFVWPRIPMDEDGDVADEFSEHPDWTIEVLSSNQSKEKVWEKVSYALDHGTQMGWLIDPKDRSILTCATGAQPQLFTQAEDRLILPNFATALELTLGDVFGWLKFGC
ncbi:MAG: Uma2 family endonuclease [Cyanobacteria bacterium P01_D01_bin.1]